MLRWRHYLTNEYSYYETQFYNKFIFVRGMFFEHAIINAQEFEDPVIDFL